MYFNDKGNTNIDNEFNEKKFKLPRFNFSSKNILLIVVGIILLIFGIVFFVRLGSKNRVTYYLELNGEELVTIYKGNEYIESGYIGRDSKGNDLTQEVMVDSNVDTSNIGDYQIVYTLHDKSLKRYITVTDKPVGATYIYLKGDNTIYLNIGEEYKEPGYLVIDSIDSSLTDKVVVYKKIDTSKKGTYQVVYTVTNSTGVTTSAKRTVIVMDGNISLSLDNDGYTNKEVGINIYIMDNYFDYLLLPDGNKIKDKSYTYKVSENGEYKFISYNKTGKGTESSITVSNIDREGPTGTCSGSYGDGKSNIIVNAQDKAGIGKYSINGNSYSSNNITVNKEYSKITVTVYDKLGNSRDITCNLSKKSIPVPSSSSSSVNPPITPGSNKNVKYNVTSDTINVWIEAVSNYYVSHIWVKDAYNQMKTAVPNNFGNELWKASDILNNAINSHGYQNRIIVAVNGSGFVLKDTYDVGYYYANKAFNMTSVSPIVIVEGKVLRDISSGNIPSSKHITYGLKKDGYLGYYKYEKGTNSSNNINTSKKIISDGVLNTIAFNPVLVDNGNVASSDTSPNIRQGFCQIDKNNFIFITNNDGSRSNGFSFKRMGEYMVSLGCKMGFNLDGGGSTTLLFKDKDGSVKALVGNSRKIADIVYFHE